MARASTSMSVYELRVYDAVPGRMEALLRRFSEHTVELFAQHGMESIGYWIDAGDPDRLIYVLRHDGSAEENWERFRSDPRWIAARDLSEADGKLTTAIDSTLLKPVAFSSLK
jgi:hypothetical protein